MVSSPLLHIAPTDEWSAAEMAGGPYRDPSLQAEGFIHLSTPEQVLIPANERFHGQMNLVLLVIDPDQLDAEVIYEDCYDTGMAFPHLYGPLPVAAVEQVLAFAPGEDGLFTLPSALA